MARTRSKIRALQKIQAETTRGRIEKLKVVVDRSYVKNHSTLADNFSRGNNVVNESVEGPSTLREDTAIQRSYDTKISKLIAKDRRKWKMVVSVLCS